MLKRLFIAGALLCAPISAHAGSYWDEAFGVAPKAAAPSKRVAHRLSRSGVQVVSGPRPRAWCGWYMGRLLGLLDPSLWLARNWAHVGTPTVARPGAVVVWPHHVGRVEAVRGNRILVHSGNDGHAVRTRWRTTRGVIAFRSV